MKIDDQSAYREATELEIMTQYLPLEGARILELGCGTARTTRTIAERFRPARIIATEVDLAQHRKNLQIEDLDRVEFVYGGAERIELEDGSIDLVIMLKSLHHVPLELMTQALSEIGRVLKPGGLAYISEPVYRGEFNEIMRLFHDEKVVRQAAFDAISQAVESGRLSLVEQIFFDAPGHFDDFAQFEARMLRVTHTEHRIDEALLQRIRSAFERHMTATGASFLKPSRVDLLRRPPAA
ncbi:MAG: class I SAM-dependent methyltransferase [Gammaproteobacteria bacterium]|nr:class I SAM-dependent methyltransferase [Gammaproteobacteria bacterium]